MLLTKISCCYVMKERKGPCLRYQAFHVEISTKMEIWTLAAFIGYDRQGLLLASKDTVTSQLLDVSLLIDQTNLLWTVANGLDKIVVGFIKNGLNGLSSSLKNDFLQRKSLKNKQTNKQTDRQKQKKEKTPNETKQNKGKKKRKHTLQKHLPQRSHGISILSVSFHFDAFSVVLQNELFRLRFDRWIMSHKNVGLMSLLHV